MEDYDGFDPQRQRTAPSMRSPDLHTTLPGRTGKAQVLNRELHAYCIVVLTTRRHCTTSVDTHRDSDFGWYKTVGYGIHLITSPAGWCRTSGAGPAAPPTPAMTSPARASTRTAGSLSPVRSGTGSKCSEEVHSGPTTGTGTVLVARASAMQVPSQ